MGRRQITVYSLSAVALVAAGLIAANLTGRTARRSEPAAAAAPANEERPVTVTTQLCGPYALQHVANQHGRSASVAQIADWAQTDDGGTSLLGLAEAAHRLGLAAQGWEASMDDLQRLTQPAIAHFNEQHFVAVLPSDDEGAIVYWDPMDQETHTVTLDDFAERWSGYLLTVEPAS